MKLLELENEFIDTYPYAGHHFNGQKSQRYIFNVKRINKPVEATAYHQQLNGKTIKVAVELSSSYGCPVRCKFCASGALGPVQNLLESEIVEQALFIVKKIEKNVPIHFCYQGIGEPSILSDTILKASKKLSKKFPNAKFKFSTMGFRPNEVIKLISSDIPWLAVQITFPHYKQEKLREIFQGAVNYKIDKVFEMVKEIKRINPKLKIKFNYILIDGFNNNKSCFKNTIKTLRANGITLDDQTEIKISFLNPTDIASIHNLKSAKVINHYDLYKYAKKELKVKNIYVFGAMKNIKVGCGQLIYDKQKGK